MPSQSIIPPEWGDQVKYHPMVVSALSEGYCPVHVSRLAADGCCRPCGDVWWELTVSAGTAPSTGPFPHFAVTDGVTVLVARDL